MRRFVLIWVVAVSCASVASAQFSPIPLGGHNPLGVPDYLEPVGDVIPLDFFDWLDVQLPEMTPLDLDSLPPSVGQELHFTEPSDVWMRFVHEVAGMRNSVGFYTYDTGSLPHRPEVIDSAYSVFPNFSAVDSGGGLESGDKVYLGNFAAGTSLGTYLTQNGWNTSAMDTFFATAFFNPESDPALRRHVVSIYNEEYDLFATSFEDINREGNSDDDFNDAVFYLTIEGEAYTGAQTVPEPSALLLAFAGLLLFALQRRRIA